MIDTFRINFESQKWKSPPSGWKVTEGTGSTLRLDGTREEFTSMLYQHAETDLRIGGSVQCPRWAEVSLPKLVNGSNGILLRESSCDRSTGLLRDLIGQSVDAPNYLDVSRIDLAGQFAGDLREWNSALRRVPHARVRRPALEFFDSGMVWPGKHLHARLYDKGLEQTGKPSNVVRLEFQTRSGMIPKGILKPGLRVDYAAAYRAYRTFCRGFAPRKVAKVSRVVELLAWCDLHRFQHDGMTPTELFLTGISPRQQRRIRQALSEIRLRYFNIDWEQLVPAKGSPRFVDYQDAA